MNLTLWRGGARGVGIGASNGNASSSTGSTTGSVLYVDVLGLSDQPRLHPGQGDCLHWCQECSMLVHAWNSLIATTVVS